MSHGGLTRHSTTRKHGACGVRPGVRGGAPPVGPTALTVILPTRTRPCLPPVMAAWVAAAAAAGAVMAAASPPYLPGGSYHLPPAVRGPGGLVFQSIPAGSFAMGFSVTPLPSGLTLSMPNRLFGNADEFPYHAVSVPALDVAVTEVTNAQFELFDPAHRALRGKFNFSVGDNEAVVFVTLADAVAYTGWLSQQGNATYRLPTESEAEHYIRAGTTTYYNTGNTFPYGKNQGDSWWPAAGRNNYSVVVNLTVAEFPANPFGLYDTHGNVEELTSDWYLPYSGMTSQGQPYPLPNTYIVTRGGSHSTDPYHLRSASRGGTHPNDMSWYIGFRVVREQVAGNRHAAWAAGVMKPAQHALHRWFHVFGSDGRPHVHRSADQAHQAAMSQASVRAAPVAVVGGPRAAFTAPPTFATPLKYVQVDTGYDIPYTTHNHDPAIEVCPNGDPVAIWFSTITEPGRESGLVTSRLRLSEGAITWDPAMLWWHTPLRCEMAPLMWYDPLQGKLFAFWGVAAAATWGGLAVYMRTSTDCGLTWGPASIIMPEHEAHHQPVNTMFRAFNGGIMMPTDNNTEGSGGTALHWSYDNGTTWTDDWNANNEYVLGIHGVVVQLHNGSLLAFGRGNDIAGTMAQSLSPDYGATWTYTASPWPGIGGGERAILLRLAEGFLMFCSFSNGVLPFPVTTACGTQRNVTGYYCAASMDEGDSWPYRRLLNEDSLGTMREQLDGVQYVATLTAAEGNGYSTARQSSTDGTIHLITSRNHYRINAAWLTTPPPCT